MNISRRDCLKWSGHSLLLAGMSQLLRNSALAADDARQMDAWVADHKILSRQLGAEKITQSAWQRGVDELYGAVNIPDLLRWIDFDRMSARLEAEVLSERGEIFEDIFVDSKKTLRKGAPEPRRVLISKLAYIEKGRSIPPHGHSNMVSAFLVIGGEFQVRQFDKLQDNGPNLIVKKTTDERQDAGAWSSISDVKNNVHWLTAKSDDCYLFTTKLIKLHDDRPSHGRINIDVLAAKELGGGQLRAPKIAHYVAAERYRED